MIITKIYYKTRRGLTDAPKVSSGDHDLRVRLTWRLELAEAYDARLLRRRQVDVAGRLIPPFLITHNYILWFCEMGLYHELLD